MSYIYSEDTPRSLTANSPRDDRFFTPRQYSSHSSSDEYVTPRQGSTATNRLPHYRSHLAASEEDQWATPRSGRGTPRSGRDNAHAEGKDASRSYDSHKHGGFDYKYNQAEYNRPDEKAQDEFGVDIDGFDVDEAVLSGMVDNVTEQDVEDIFSYARHGRCADIERLLDRGIPINVRDHFGNTMLTIACQNGNKRVAKCVLRRGADINAKNQKGNTPLHYCFHYGYGDTLGQYLISKGADSAARNNTGKPTWDGI